MAKSNNTLILLAQLVTQDGPATQKIDQTSLLHNKYKDNAWNCQTDIRCKFLKKFDLIYLIYNKWFDYLKQWIINFISIEQLTEMNVTDALNKIFSWNLRTVTQFWWCIVDNGMIY